MVTVKATEKPVTKEEYVDANTEEFAITVEPYNGPDMKAALDESIAAYMGSEQGFMQSFLYLDVRLAIGYLAVADAVACAYCLYKIGFRKTREILVWGVATYFLLYLCLQLWQYFVEDNCVYRGHRRTTVKNSNSKIKTNDRKKGKVSKSNEDNNNDHDDGNDELENITVRSYGKTLDPVYRVKIDLAGQTLTPVGNYMLWFDEEGTMDRSKFFSWLDSIMKSTRRKGD